MQSPWLLLLLASLFLTMATLAGTVVQEPGNLEEASQAEESSDPEQPVVSIMEPGTFFWWGGRRRESRMSGFKSVRRHQGF